MIRINQIKLPIDHKEAALEKKIKKALHNTEYKQYKIVKRSIDARKKEELSYVGLEKAIIKIDVVLTENMNSRGYDEVQFLVSANPGEPLKPLERVLSGGELSRIMLALKCVFVDKDKIPTLIFDEIDTGISGIAAQIVGEKLSKIGKKKQVMCITHLPQIAANGHTHYRIEKNTSNNRTYTNIKELTFDERIDEIARLIAGNNITEKTIEHAHEIIELAQCD